MTATPTNTWLVRRIGALERGAGDDECGLADGEGAALAGAGACVVLLCEGDGRTGPDEG